MADPTEKRFDVVLNVQLDQTHKAMLTQLANKHSLKMSQEVRKLIDAAYRMEFGAAPHCATGAGCLCPQVHALQNVHRPTGAELVAQNAQRHGA